MQKDAEYWAHADVQELCNNVGEIPFTFWKMPQDDADIYIILVGEESVFEIWIPHEHPHSLPFGMLFDEVAYMHQDGHVAEWLFEKKMICHTLRFLQAFVDEGFGAGTGGPR